MIMRPLLIIAAISGFFAVLLGAMGSHFLSPLMSDKGQALFNTANLYHLIHSLALLGCALLASIMRDSPKALTFLKWAAGCYCLGILLFSGILYFVAISPGFALHYLIPLGGLCYMVGWLMLVKVALTIKRP